MLTGMDGTDTASYARGSSGGVSVNLQITGSQDTGGAGTDTFADTFLDPDSEHEIENVIGTNFKDALKGSDVANTLRGRGGNDRLLGRAGPDTLLGQRGLDHLFALDGEADTSLSCGPGANAVEDAEVDPTDPPAISC